MARFGLNRIKAALGSDAAADVERFHDDWQILRTQIPQMLYYGRVMSGSKTAMNLADQTANVWSPITPDKIARDQLANLQEKLEAMRNIEPAWKEQMTPQHADDPLLDRANSLLGPSAGVSPLAIESGGTGQGAEPE
jgi:hypothetical protein